MIDETYDWYLTDRFGKKIFFYKNQVIIGRKDCDIQLKSTSVNYKHCIISINDDDKRLRIKDFKTANGTFVNDRQITADEFIMLHVGDKIRLAYDQITFTVSKHLGNSNVAEKNTDIRAKVSPGSPLRGAEIPLLVTDPEKCMLSALCELNDSIIDLNSSSDSQDCMSKIENSNVSYDSVSTEELQENINVKIPFSPEQPKKDTDQPCTPSRPAETFTINFDVGDIDNVDNGSTAVISRFVPSKLRSSFEEREKMKRLKPQPLKSSNKTDISSSTRSAEIPTRTTKANGKITTVTSQNSKPLRNKVNPKIEEKVQTVPRNNGSKPKTSTFDRLSKPISSSPRISKVDRVKKPSPKNPAVLSTENQLPPDKVEPLVEIYENFTSTFKRGLSTSYIIDKNLNEDQLSIKLEDPLKEVEQAHPSGGLPNLKSKSHLPDNNFVEEKNCPGKKNSFENVFETKESKEKTEIIRKAEVFPSPKIIKPTLSKKNSKSYLLEKMLLGEELGCDFLAYEESKTGESTTPITHSPDLPAKINDDIQGSIDNLSEAGTYVIDNCADGKTVNLSESDDTLGKENTSSISSVHFTHQQELETKSSGKWLSEFPGDDVTINCDNKGKRIVNSKFTGSSMPHIPNEDYFATNKRDNYRDDEHSKSNYNCMATDNRHKTGRNSEGRNIEDDNNNKRNVTMTALESQQQYDNNFQNTYSSYSSVPYGMEHQSEAAVVEDVYVPDVSNKSTVPSNICSKASNLQPKSKNTDSFTSGHASIKYHPRSTFSVASLDTALLLQDTEALLNDMEKRVYSRKDKRDETSKSQSFSTNVSHNEKIPFVDETEEKEEDSSLFNNSSEIDDSVRTNSMKPSQPIALNEQIILEDSNRSYVVRSPINSGNIRRNNSCKLGISESMTLSRKLNSTLRNQRSCSMIEEQRQNHLLNSNNNSESFNDYRSKSKPSILAMNSGLAMNRRGSAGISSALNSPISRMEPGSFFNNGFSVQRSKDVFPYFSTNMLSLHRQRFNRYEYGQHSLKYNSNSTTMLYNKYNNISPPWNGEDTIISPNSIYPTYDSEYYAYNTMPEAMDASMLLSKPDHNITNNNSQIHVSNLELNPEIDYNKREDIGEFSQPCNVSGRSSAFSPVNSLHQSTESVNNYQMTSKSRSSMGLNEQKNCNYDILLVSSVHQYSARLCRYTEEIVHRMRREGSDYQGNSPVETLFDQSDAFGQLKSVNRELQETVSNLRSLEKQLQKVERFIFPIEKSGRNSTAGSCTEDNYLNQLERINKELKDFVPIDDLVSSNSTTNNDYPCLPTSNDSKENSALTFKSVAPSKNKETLQVAPKSHSSEAQLDPPQTTFTSSEVRSTPKSKYSSISKRFQHRKD